jgi:hypothetical protein
MAGAGWYFRVPVPRVSPKAATPLSLENLVRAPRARTSSADQEIVQKTSTVSKPCRASWDSLSALDLQRFQEGGDAALPMELVETCSGENLPGQFTGPMQLFKDSCSAFANSGDPTGRAVCYQSMVFLRSVIADFDSPGKTAESIASPQLLADKLIASLFGDLTQGLPYAQKLLELEPNSVPAAKIAAVLEMVSLDSGRGSVSPESAGRALERAFRLDPENAPFYEKLQNAVDLAAAPDEAARIEVATKIAQSEPSSPQKTYLASYVAFKEKRFNDASKLLADALKKEPQNPDFLQTQKDLAGHLKRKTPGLEAQKIFNHSYQLDLTSLVP